METETEHDLPAGYALDTLVAVVVLGATHGSEFGVRREGHIWGIERADEVGFDDAYRPPRETIVCARCGAERYGFGDGSSPCDVAPRPYSSLRRDAAQVETHMMRAGYSVATQGSRHGDDDEWTVSYTKGPDVFRATASTVEVAICNAAVSALNRQT
jgi:hypothetical protein